MPDPLPDNNHVKQPFTISVHRDWLYSIRCGDCPDPIDDRVVMERFKQTGIHVHSDNEYWILSYYRCPTCGHRIILKEVGPAPPFSGPAVNPGGVSP